MFKSLLVKFLTSNLVKNQFLHLVSDFAKVTGTWLVTQGALSPQDATGSVWLGSVMAIGGVLWSLLAHYAVKYQDKL